MASSQPRPMMIVVHDASPRFMDQLSRIVSLIRNRIQDRFACAVVPDWHAQGSDYSTNQQREFAEMVHCDQWLMHGLTHRRESRRGLISWATDASDEFSGLSVMEIQSRVDASKAWINRVYGQSVCGLVPPAWQLPTASESLDGIDFVMRFGTLESCYGRQRFPLRTYSYDWGHLPLIARGATWASCCWASTGQWFDQSRLASRRIPCLAIHPADVCRGWLPRIERWLDRFLDRGFQPITPGELLAASEVAYPQIARWGECEHEA